MADEAEFPEYRTVFSNRRTLAVEVTRAGEIIVRAPEGVKPEIIREAVGRNLAWIEKKLSEVRARIETNPEPTPEEEEELIRLAKATLPAKAEHYARLMNVTPAHISITRARTRFGSCSGNNRICFSCLLMKYPDEAIDYVVVHELAHIKQHNHSALFWREVDKILPDRRERQKLLKK